MNIKRLSSCVCALVLAAGIVNVPIDTFSFGSAIHSYAYEYEEEEPADDDDYVKPDLGAYVHEDLPIYTLGNFQYQLNDDGTANIVKYTGNETNVIIPSTLNGAAVIGLSGIQYRSGYTKGDIYIRTKYQGVFAGNTSLKSVVIPNGVKIINALTFKDCTSLESVTIPDSVTTIGESAFSKCTSLTNISIPSSVTKLYGLAFANCVKLKSVVLSAGLQTIGVGCFYNCSSLGSISLPSTLTGIECSAFSDCTSLKSISIPDSVKTIENFAFYRCTELANVNVSPYVTNIGIKPFGLTKFSSSQPIVVINGILVDGSNAKGSLTIPTTVTTIAKDAFTVIDSDGKRINNTSLTSVEIPYNVNYIYGFAFRNCVDLTKVTFQNRLPYISYHAFSGSPNVVIYCHSKYRISAIETGKSYSFIDTNIGRIYKPTDSDYNPYDTSEWEGLDDEEEYDDDGTYEFYEGEVDPTVPMPKPAHVHSYTSAVTKEASCTAEGTRTYTCSCGDKYTETIPAKGHTYTTTTIAPTCTTEGYTEHTCSACGDTYKDNIKPAKGHTYTTKVVAPTTTAQGYTLHTCSVCGNSYKDSYTDKLPAAVSKVNISKATAKFSSTSITYSGKAKMPKLTVKYNGKTLVKGTDYKVTVSNAKKVGKATAKITGIGNYTGTKKLTYYVVPVKPTISKVTSTAKKKATVQWKKNSTATGYQIQVSLKKNFSSKKSYSISKNSTVKGTISKLTSGKTYYVRMRCYKTIDGVKKYSAYSAVKTVKVK